MGAANPNALPGDLRFVMVWGGYFGLWVSASFALRVMPRLNFGAETGFERLKTRQLTTKPQNANALFRAEVLERLALEIASLPAAERRALVEEFTVRLSYETADELEIHVAR